jgi:hypothetical protein
VRADPIAYPSTNGFAGAGAMVDGVVAPHTVL